MQHIALVFVAYRLQELGRYYWNSTSIFPHKLAKYHIAHNIDDVIQILVACLSTRVIQSFFISDKLKVGAI